MDEHYVKKLESVIAKMLEPIKGVPFGVIIKGLCDCEVIPFDNTNKQDLALLKKLKKVALKAGQDINQNPIVRKRANEVGNDIENYVKRALDNVGYNADVPSGNSGNKKSTGYPDLIFFDEYGRANYLECKTYNENSYDTSFRSFYLSPSSDFKITQDAHHFVISYEIYVVGRKGDKNIYKAKAWKLLSIADLICDVKHEFNSDNNRLYSKELIIAEGSIKE